MRWGEGRKGGGEKKDGMGGDGNIGDEEGAVDLNIRASMTMDMEFSVLKIIVYHM